MSLVRIFGLLVAALGLLLAALLIVFGWRDCDSPLVDCAGEFIGGLLVACFTVGFGVWLSGESSNFIANFLVAVTKERSFLLVAGGLAVVVTVIAFAIVVVLGVVGAPEWATWIFGRLSFYGWIAVLVVLFLFGITRSVSYVVALVKRIARNLLAR